MTRDEIMAMQPGREMDALVMKTIFNARKGYYGEESVWYHYDENGEPDYEWSCYNSPSTDISAAWQVVEKMKDTEYQYEFNEHMDRGYFTSVTPLIICRSALLAVMEVSE